ncbi:MAG: hypothetical protein ACLFVE_03165 [Chitinispirillaceae bacterium]
MEFSNSRTAKSILNDCLSLRRYERCLVLCDEFCIDTAKQFWDVARSMCREAVMVTQSDSRKSEFQPATPVQSWIGQFDTALVFSCGVIDEVELCGMNDGCATRMALFPKANADNFFESLSADWVKLGVFTRKCAALLGAAKSIKVTTEDGTDLVFDNSGNLPLVRDGRITSAGMVGTFPAGMAGIVVSSGSARGKLSVSNSAQQMSLMEIKDGRASQVISSDCDSQLERFIKGRQSWRILSRFGVGTLDTVTFDAQAPDLRARGLVHFEFGIKNDQLKNPVHHFILDNADVWLDNRLWIERGCYV